MSAGGRERGNGAPASVYSGRGPRAAKEWEAR